MKPKIMNKDDIIRISIYAENQHGEGIGRHDDFIIFVKGAKKGSECKVRVVDVKRTYATGEII